MEIEPQQQTLQSYAEQQEQVFRRLQPASETEEHLARQIALCHTKLSRLQGWLGKAWGQFQKFRENSEVPPVL